MIELFGHNGKRYACLGMFKPEAFKPKNTVSDIKHGGGSTSVVHGVMKNKCHDPTSLTQFVSLWWFCESFFWIEQIFIFLSCIS